MVGMPHEMKGQGIAAFVTLRSGVRPTDALKKELMNVVTHANRQPGPARSDSIHRCLAEDPQRQDHAAIAEGNRRPAAK